MFLILGFVSVISSEFMEEETTKTIISGKYRITISGDEYEWVDTVSMIDGQLKIVAKESGKRTKTMQNTLSVYDKESKKIDDILLSGSEGKDIFTYNMTGEEEYLKFGTSSIVIIEITDADHLNSTRGWIKDVYDNVSVLDNITVTINSEEYLRVKFKHNLTSGNDITIYASSKDNASVKVYEKDSDMLIADFGAIGNNISEYKIYLTNLNKTQDTFDLKVVKGDVEFDFVIDPTLTYATVQDVYGILGDGTSKTGVLNTTFQVRSCNDAICSGEIFVGPDNTSSTYFTNATSNTLNETLTPNNTYFQYKAFFRTEDQNYTSYLFNVTIGYTEADAENPNATLISPENNTYLDSSSNNFTSNLTDNLGLKNVTINIYNSTGLVNQTTQSLSDAVSYTWGIVIDLADGVYTWFVSLFDNADNSDTTANQTFTIDTTHPLISLIYPTAVNYTSIQTQLNFSRSDTNLAGCWYNLGGANSSYDETCANLTGLDSGQGTSTWTIYVNDSAGNENSSSITFFVDSIVPVVNIDYPEPQTYAYNESLPLNYTSTDANLESCWYKVVNSTGYETISNTTLTDCLNTTFNVPRSDEYTLTLYSNDSLGNENSDTVTFQISLASPSIVLDYPTDDLWLTEKDNVYFNFTATDSNGIDTCELWTNSTGTWHKNVTFTGVISGTQNWTQINLAETKGYIWNVWCNDTTGLSDWALSNFTFNVDTINPLIEYTTGTESDNTNTTNNFIFVNVTASDTNENNIVFRLYNQTSEINVSTYTTPIRQINWTNLPDAIYTYNVTITDDAGRSNTTELRTITLDTTAPEINITLPQAINYADNNTIKLNYTVSDNLIGLESCWYKVVNSTGYVQISNTTIASCLNTTFGLPSGDVDYTITLYSNDTLGNENSDLVTFGIRTEPPVIVLSPPDNTYSDTGTNLTFNFTVTTNADSITNCSLYGNFNGTWLLNQTSLIPVKGVSTSFQLISLSEGDYIWNTLCYDDLENNGWADNLTFVVDTTLPTTTINSITTTADSKVISFNHTTTDTNIDTCKYSIFDSTGGIDGANENKSFTCGTLLNVSATVTDYATYNLTIYATDLASNENSTTTAFTTSESADAPAGGGGATTITETVNLTGYQLGDGICETEKGESFFNSPEDCTQFTFPNLDEVLFNCFDDDEDTTCVWETNPGLFIVLGFMVLLLAFTILFEFKPEAKGTKKWVFKPKTKWKKRRR